MRRVFSLNFRNFDVCIFLLFPNRKHWFQLGQLMVFKHHCEVKIIFQKHVRWSNALFSINTELNAEKRKMKKKQLCVWTTFSFDVFYLFYNAMKT